MRLTTAAAALTLGAATALASGLPAHAGEPRTGTLVCDNGQTYTMIGQLYGSGNQLDGSTHNFVMTYLRVDSTGQEIRKRSPGKERLDTLHCTYTISNRPGLTATVEGFLTPRT